MATTPNSIIIALIMIVPTLLVYFGGRKKQKAETTDLISATWEKLTKAQDAFSDQMEDRLKTLNGRITDQDKVIARQNATIAAQNQTIAAQTEKISEQGKIILEQQCTIADLTKQIEGMGATPIHKRGKNGRNQTTSPLPAEKARKWTDKSVFKKEQLCYN